jgi:hypothetical protein
MAAWNFEFPTAAEQVLWRTCCIISIAGDIYLLLAVKVVIDTDDISVAFGNSHLYNWQFWKFVHMASLVFLLAARVAIIMESFISLRRVPAGAYATVAWAEAIPHF